MGSCIQLSFALGRIYHDAMDHERFAAFNCRCGP
jgi:hypothetical protein